MILGEVVIKAMTIEAIKGSTVDLLKWRSFLWIPETEKWKPLLGSRLIRQPLWSFRHLDVPVAVYILLDPLLSLILFHPRIPSGLLNPLTEEGTGFSLDILVADASHH
jgi:hypothetical protein